MSNGRVLRCKPYHQPRGIADAGRERSRADRKSTCPGWLLDPALRQRLLDEALIDPDGGLDSMGNPKRLWNAINGRYFVGVSTNEQHPSYNCYPETPSVLLEDLTARAARSIEDILARGDD